MSASTIEVSYKVVGGKLKTIELAQGAKVSDLVKAAGLEGNYAATIGSNPAEMSDTLAEGHTVFLSLQVKGA